MRITLDFEKISTTPEGQDRFRFEVVDDLGNEGEGSNVDIRDLHNVLYLAVCDRAAV